MINPGTIPDVTISAKESNSLPNSPSTLNNLAKKPSKKSKNIPKKTKNTASINLSDITINIATSPDNKFNEVNT